MRREARDSGVSSLGTVLLCMVVLAGILFVAVSAALSHLQVANAAEAQAHARNLAESAIAQALHEISESGTQPAGDTVVTIEGVVGTGMVTFNPGVDSRGYSVFNLEGASSVPGTRGKIVPPRMVHLVGRGEVGSARSYVECLFSRPPFPDGLVASGPVKAEALQLYAIRRDSSYSGGDPTLIDAEEVLPGNLFSNSNEGWVSGAPTVQLLQSTEISGSVGAVGSVSVDATSSVGGELRPASSPRPIARIDIVSKISALKPNAIPIASSGSDLSLDPNWFSISTGSLSVGGDLDLNGSALLVEGDLDVQGAIEGTGVVLVTGSVAIRDGGASVIAGEQTAIGCGGDFLLQAADPEGNYFKGLVYCEGEFKAKDITVVGATVVNAESNPSARGEAELENVRFLHNPGSVELSLMTPKSYEIEYGTSGGNRSHHIALAFIRTPSENGDGFYYEVHGYSTRKSDATQDSPGIWRTYGTDDFQPSWAWHIRSDLVRIAPGMSLAEMQSHPDVVALANTLGARFQQDENKPVSEVDWTGRLLEPSDGLASLLHTDLQNTNSGYNVTFSLNSLLGEWLDSQRIQMWRPILDED